MNLVTQTAAAHSIGRTPRTIRYWIQRGKLKRRRHDRVALEDVEILAIKGSKETKHSICGGFSGGCISYSKAGRPPGRPTSQLRHFLELDSDKQVYIWGKLLEVHPDMTEARSVTDVERNLEIRFLGWTWLRIMEGDASDKMWRLLPALRCTRLITDTAPLSIER